MAKLLIGLQDQHAPTVGSSTSHHQDRQGGNASIVEGNGKSVIVRTINEKGLAIIKQSEGLSLTPYICPGGYLSIGYGNRTHAGQYERITEEQAEQFLLEDIEDTCNNLTKLLGDVPLTDNQFSALVSFVFNVGIGAFKRSTMFRLIKDGKYREAGDQFDRWVYAKGKKLPGLVARRAKEKALWLEAVYDAL